MKKLLLSLSLILSSQIVTADYYDVTLTRTGDDTYLVENWSAGHEFWEIETDYCYEDAYYDDAILSYSWEGYDNYLEFSNGYSCEFRQALNINVYD